MNRSCTDSPEFAPRQPQGRAYGALSLMALANAVAFAGTSRAADATTAPATTADGTTKHADKSAVQPAATAPGVTRMNPIYVTAAPNDGYNVEQATGLPYFTEPLLDTPGTITVIPQQVIKDQNATSLRDVLRNVPGITFQAGEASSSVAGDNLSMRGFNVREDLFIDGIRDTGLYTRDPFNTEQVEVVKGPASAYEGYGETGGSIDLVSKTPFLTPRYEIDGGVGTNAYDRESVDLNQPITEFGDTGMAFRLNAFHQYNEEANRNFVYNGRWGFAPSLAFGLGTPTRVIVSYLHQRQDDLPDYGFPFVNAAAVARGDFPKSQLNQVAPLPYSNWYGLYNRDHQTSIADIPTLTIQHDFDDGIKLENQSRYDRVHFTAYNTSARFDTTPPLLPGEITRESSTRDDEDVLIDDKTFATIPFEVFHISNTLVTSLELSKESDDFRTGAGPNQQTSMTDPNAFQNYTGNITWTDPQHNEIQDVAWSLFDTVKFTPQWELSGGMRFDHLDERYQDRGSLTPHNFDREDNLASWRLALVYKPLQNGSIYCGYGTSYNPSIQGAGDGATNDSLNANLQNLPPEEDESYELGTKWDFLDDKLSLNLALFRTNKTNARVTDPTQPGTVLILAGEQRDQGVEFDASGNLTPEWKIFGGYVYQVGKVVEGPKSAFPGNALPFTPTQSASLWTTYDLPFHLTVGTGGQFVDSRYSGVNELNSSPGYWLQNAMLGYNVTKNVDLQFNVTNLWDKHYIDLVGAHQAVPGVGRTFVFSTRLTF